MTKMLEKDNKPVKTWSGVTGCDHDCIFCWARDLICGRLKNTNKYQKCGFKPTLHEKEFKKSFGKGNTWFIVDMGDLWGKTIPDEWIYRVLDKCQEADRSNTFYFVTKNPARYREFEDRLKDNYVMCATIESNRHYPEISKAPTPYMRHFELMCLKHPRKGVIIEPVMEFGLVQMTDWMREIVPEFVYIGYDNHHKKLSEPELKKVEKLIYRLEDICEVRKKTIREKWDYEA